MSDTPTVGLGKLLTDARFRVPNHQRDYSWSVEEVKQLLDDLELAIERESSFYFLGLIVLMESENNDMVVLDGQQRLATATIFFSAVRNWLSQYSPFKEESIKVQDRLVATSEIGKSDPLPRLILNSANNECFNKYVIDSVAISEIRRYQKTLNKQDRNRPLIESVIYCHDRIEELANKEPNSEPTAQQLFKMIQYIIDNVKIISFVVSDEGSAYTIFETLNDRGLDLSPLDLVKNYVFGRVEQTDSSRIAELENKWAQMMGNLANVKADSFLKAFWTSRHGRIQTANLFDALKKEYSSSKAALNLCGTMLKSAEIFSALEASDDPIWASYSQDFRETIRSLRILGGKQVYPVILAGIEKFNSKEFEKLAWLLEVLIVRYQLIGGGRTGALEIACARLAQLISSSELITAENARSQLKDIFPSDEDFQSNFKGAKESNSQKAQYILRKMEQEERRRKKGEMASEVEPGKLTIEHILPRNPGKEWKTEITADPSLVEDCVYRLGNLCLLTSVNKKLGRLHFQKKRETYLGSELFGTRKLGDYDNWNRKTIELRQNYMAKLAVSIWGP